jgi:hypothetical protein
VGKGIVTKQIILKDTSQEAASMYLFKKNDRLSKNLVGCLSYSKPWPNNLKKPYYLGIWYRFLVSSWVTKPHASFIEMLVPIRLASLQSCSQNLLELRIDNTTICRCWHLVMETLKSPKERSTSKHKWSRSCKGVPSLLSQLMVRPERRTSSSTMWGMLYNDILDIEGRPNMWGYWSP